MTQTNHISYLHIGFSYIIWKFILSLWPVCYSCRSFSLPTVDEAEDVYSRITCKHPPSSFLKKRGNIIMTYLWCASINMHLNKCTPTLYCILKVVTCVLGGSKQANVLLLWSVSHLRFCPWTKLTRDSIAKSPPTVSNGVAPLLAEQTRWAPLLLIWKPLYMINSCHSNWQFSHWYCGGTVPLGATVRYT